jgi:hypothetical protein
MIDKRKQVILGARDAEVTPSLGDSGPVVAELVFVVRFDGACVKGTAHDVGLQSYKIFLV